jgi:hypothetical protein
MALKEKITFEDLALYTVLSHPVFCGEFINNIDRFYRDEPFEFTWYQKEILCDFNPFVSLCQARATGKTVSLSNMITWILVNNLYNGDYVNYHVPGKAHVEPVFTALVRLFRTNSLLKHFMTSGTTGVNSSDLIIKLVNGASLLCRIAGQTGTGLPVIGLHSPFVIVDEGGYYPHGTWSEMQPTLNTFTSGYRMVVAGVPTGLRENNVLFHVDQENSEFTKHRVSAFQNPRFSHKDLEKAIETYGGEESDEFVHLVKGEHGKPIFSLFDRTLMSIESYPVYKLTIDGVKLFGNIGDYFNKISTIPGLPNRNSTCIMGVDLGYTEPTAIYILYLDNQDRLKFHAKIQLNKVDYFIQEKIIDWLDTKFNPSFIGIDEGSAGKAVIPRLQEADEFANKDFKKRIIPINFSSQIVLGTDSAGEEIKSKAKPFAVSVLQEYSVNHKIIYSSTDLETITELERMTYSKTPTGEIVYRTLTERGGKRGDDHFTAALLCASLSYYLELGSLEFRAQRKKLARPKWFF